MTKEQLIKKIKSNSIRHCSKCKKDLSVSNFFIKEYVPGKFKFDSPCKKCNIKVKDKEYMRGYMLKRNFNIGIGEYDNMLIKQRYSCAICGKHESQLSKKLAVDHCHKSGQIRKLLCHNCNAGLGHFNDNSELLYKAIEYLKS